MSAPTLEEIRKRPEWAEADALHHSAMEHADMGDFWNGLVDCEEEAAKARVDAARLETRACYLLSQLPAGNNQPSLSILTRSAAWLWLRADSPGRALVMVRRGFRQPNVPLEIRDELHEAKGAAEWEVAKIKRARREARRASREKGE